MNMARVSAVAAVRTVLSALAFATCGPCFAQDAPVFNITHSRTSSTEFPGGLKLPLKEIWSRNIGGPVSYPVIAEGKVFVVRRPTYEWYFDLFALDIENGQTIWRKRLNSTGAAAYNNGKLFIQETEGPLWAFNASDGGSYGDMYFLRNMRACPRRSRKMA